MTLAAPSSGAGGELKTRQVDQLQYLSNTHMFQTFLIHYKYVLFNILYLCTRIAL